MTTCVTDHTIAENARIRTLILSAVHDELLQNGYRTMSLCSVAARAGVREDAARELFVSKESILVAHLDRMYDSLLSLLRGIAKSQEPVRDRVRDLLLARIVFRFDVLRPYAARIDEMREPLLLAVRRRGPVYIEAEARILERLLAEGQRSGSIDLADPAPLSRTLLTATNALLPSEATLSPMPGGRELRRVAGELIDMLTKGLLVPNWCVPGHESPRIDATAL